MKNLILTACTVFLSITLIQAQESKETIEKNSKQEKLHIKLKDGAKPDIYVDGKKFDFPMDLLDPNRIESINVLKGDKAVKEYNAKNGVVLITTKKEKVDIDKSQVRVIGNGAKDEKAPVIIINGEKSDQELLNKLSPDDIESIEVFKDDEQALKKYNAPNGVIIVTTKKEKKK